MNTAASRRARFIEEYSRHANASRAAVRAGYAPAKACDASKRLLAHPDVLAALEEHRRQYFEACEDEGERVLAEAMRVAFCDLHDLLDAEGRIKPMADIEDDVLAGVRVFNPIPPYGKTRRVRRHDKIGALKLLGRYLQMFDLAGTADAEGLAADLAAPHCDDTEGEPT